MKAGKMENSYWASTHPAWTPSGYKCKCGLLFDSMEGLFSHININHDGIIARGYLSAKQYERYCKLKGMK